MFWWIVLAAFGLALIRVVLDLAFGVRLGDTWRMAAHVFMYMFIGVLIFPLVSNLLLCVTIGSLLATVFMFFVMILMAALADHAMGIDLKSIGLVHCSLLIATGVLAAILIVL
jgi:hypothetical protein